MVLISGRVFFVKNTSQTQVKDMLKFDFLSQKIDKSNALLPRSFLQQCWTKNLLFRLNCIQIFNTKLSDHKYTHGSTVLAVIFYSTKDICIFYLVMSEVRASRNPSVY